jgi:hypothetical protein
MPEQKLEIVNIHIDTYDRMFAEWALKVFGRATDDATSMRRFDISLGLELDMNGVVPDHLSFIVRDGKKCLVARLKYEF